MTRPSIKFRSLRVTPEFRDFVLDQLAGVAELRSRRMFGGVGLYSGARFFGIVAADELFFKVDDGNRAAYEAAGSEPFRPLADPSAGVDVVLARAARGARGSGRAHSWARAAIHAAGAPKPKRKAGRERPARDEK